MPPGFSWIAHDFVTRVLGVQPAQPGFAEILIAPQTGAADWARGRVPTPAGFVQVDWQGDAETGDVSLNARTPDGTPTTIALPRREPQRFKGGGSITLP